MFIVDLGFVLRRVVDMATHRMSGGLEICLRGGLKEVIPYR